MRYRPLHHVLVFAVVLLLMRPPPCDSQPDTSNKRGAAQAGLHSTAPKRNRKEIMMKRPQLPPTRKYQLDLVKTDYMRWMPASALSRVRGKDAITTFDGPAGPNPGRERILPRRLEISLAYQIRDMLTVINDVNMFSENDDIRVDVATTVEMSEWGTVSLIVVLLDVPQDAEASRLDRYSDFEFDDLGKLHLEWAPLHPDNLTCWDIDSDTALAMFVSLTHVMQVTLLKNIE